MGGLEEMEANDFQKTSEILSLNRVFGTDPNVELIFLFQEQFFFSFRNDRKKAVRTFSLKRVNATQNLCTYQAAPAQIMHISNNGGAAT